MPQKPDLSSGEQKLAKATSRVQIIADLIAKANPPQSESNAAKKREKRRSGWWRTRIGALGKVFRSRYGGDLYQFPDDDAGREDLRILLDHYAYSNPLAMPRIIKTRAPWLTESERDSLMAQIGRFSRYWTSEALADALRLTEAVRLALGGVPTIGAIDVTPEQRKELRKQRDSERKRQKRRAAKMQSRTQYLAANSISREKPWEADGISRRTWYRRRGTSPSAVNLVNAAEQPVPTSSPSATAAIAVSGKMSFGRAKNATAQASGTVAPLEATNLTPLRIPATASKPAGSERLGLEGAMVSERQWKEAA